MTFNDFEYQRPEMQELQTRFAQYAKDFSAAKNFQDQRQAFNNINTLRQEFGSMLNICHIRHTINTKDAFYEQENEYFDKNNPLFKAINIEFYKLLLSSPYKKDLENEYGKQIFNIAEMSLKTFQPEVLEYLQEENKLSSQYVKLKAGAKIDYKGKIYNLSALTPLENAKDRNTRKEAGATKWRFFEKNTEKIGEIFDKQVKLRHKIAQKLGYDNFVSLGYARMLRSDYTATQVAQFRKLVQNHIVPIATALFERQTKRIGLDTLHYYDENFCFASGNPKPNGSAEWIIKHATTMYNELSAETGQFFKYMRERNLMDLVNKEGKATGGYCAFIRKYKSPYIFSNFNGTSDDIDVLTHEAGHAFQVYSSAEIPVNEYIWPTYEACEIHSMSMEFFTWPWMHLFFGEDTDKYKFAHLASAIKFIPYGVAIDEFQHYVYKNPEITPQERNAAWREIEKKYLPHQNYSSNSFLESGTFWQKQSHIFTTPFYYIDYCLAQICAFQFWSKDQQDHQTAWADYLKLCQAGGSKSFLELVELANLESPFETTTFEKVIGEVKQWLDGIDDFAF